jgi:tetratricopeptide (TPR) repeat protein
MRHIRNVTYILSAALLISCNRDPEVAKKKYLENGNRYFANAKYKEASIMYRNAIQKDPKFGEAYYRLALTEWKLGRMANTVRPLERAVGLLDKSKPEYADASLKLGEVYVAAAGEQTVPARRAELLTEAERISSGFLKADSNSYEGYKLQGDVALIKAADAIRSGARDAARQSLDAAVRAYQRADEIRPRQTAVQLALARTFAILGQSDKAEKVFQTVLSQDKTHAIAYQELYRMYTLQKRPLEAEAILKAAIQNNPGLYDFRRLLAVHYYAAGKPDDMAKALETLTSHAKEYARAYVTAGDFYLGIGKPDEAIRQYRAGIQATPGMKVECQKRIIEVLIRQGKPAEAAELNREVLKENPKDFDARAYAASLLIDSGEISKAVNELENVVNSNPRNFVARFQLGRARAARNEWEQARQQYNLAVRENSNYLPARLALAGLQLNRHESEASLESVQQILAIDPQNEPARLIQAGALAALKKTDQSRAVLGATLKNNPKSAEAWSQLGSLEFSQKKYKEAESAYRKSYELQPAKLRPLVGIAETYAAQNRLRDAVQALAAERPKHPDRVDLLMMMVSYQVRAGDTSAALAELQSVLPKLKHDDKKTTGEVCFQMAEIYRLKGDGQNAISWLRRAYEAQPDDFVITGNLAILLDSAGQKAEARRLYEQSLRKEPDNPIVLNNLAFLLVQNGGDLDEALTLAQRAKRSMPNSHEISDTLGMVYLKKNLTDNAIQIFRILVKEKPNNPIFREHLSQALTQKEGKLAQNTRTRT